jgi:hypothetical protein
VEKLKPNRPPIVALRDKDTRSPVSRRFPGLSATPHIYKKRHPPLRARDIPFDRSSPFSCPTISRHSRREIDLTSMQSGYDEKNYEAGKEGVVDPSRDAYGYTEPIGEDVEVREEETKRELKPR